MNIKNFARIVEILDRKSRFLGNAEYYYLHNAPRIVEIIVLHCVRVNGEDILKNEKQIDSLTWKFKTKATCLGS